MRSYLHSPRSDAEDAVLAAAHGKHILMEKPIARRLEEADRMIQTAKAGGVALMVAENFRFMPAFRRVQGYLAEGWVGAVRQIQISALGRGNPRGWRLDPERMGGGALIDGGIHYVDLLLQWGGVVKRLYALDRKSTRLNSSHSRASRMPSSA